jgi:LPXTG-motif cell wall-anchored protein
VRVSVTVTNSGGVRLRSITVADALVRRLGSSVRCASSTLAPGASTTCTSGTVRVTRTQARVGTFRNQVRVTGRTSTGQLVRSAVSTATLRVQRIAPASTGKKHPKKDHSNKQRNNRRHGDWQRRKKQNSNKQPRTKKPRPITMTQYVLQVIDVNKNGKLEGGDSVRFGFHVVNTGTASLDGLQIVDRRLKRFKVAISCAATKLAPGETTLCTSGKLRITPFQAKNDKLGRNFAYATAVVAGAPVRSKSTVITLEPSVAALRRMTLVRQLPNTGNLATIGQVGAAGGLLMAGAFLILLSRRRRRPATSRT